MRKVITLVEVWDDLALADGRQVEATETVRLAYGNGKPGKPREVEIDLSALNKALLEEMLAPYLAAGHAPPERIMRTGSARVGGAHTGTGPKHEPGIREYNRNMRAWADEHGGPDHPQYHYHVQMVGGKRAGKYYHSLALKENYARYLAEQERAREMGDD